MVPVFLSTLVLLSAVPGHFSLPIISSDTPTDVVHDREQILAPDCLTHIYVFAQTAVPSGSGSNNIFKYAIGALTMYYKADLHDMPGDQTSEGKGDLWKLSLWKDFRVPITKCIKKDDFWAAIEYGGTDGWKIDSVISLYLMADGHFEMGTVDVDVNKWIDWDGDPRVQPGVVRFFSLNTIFY